MPELGGGAGLAGSPDWGGLGLVLAIAGSFLIACGSLIRDPESLLEKRFGEPGLRLRTLREFAFQRVQMVLGFGFLIGGFALQLFARTRGAEAESVRPGQGDGGGSTALWIGGLLALVVLLEVVGWWWSMLSIRRSLRRWLSEHPSELDTDPQLAREVGELYGIASHANDTVQSYVARLRRALDLPVAAMPRPRREPELAAEDRE